MFIALRVAFLQADPPTSLPNHANIYELFTDPPAKSYEARSFALFGTWSTAPGDNYAFWRPQSPVWVYPLALYYRVFGVSYASLRVFSTLCATAGLAVFLALLARKLRGLPFLVAGALLTVNYYHVVYARSGLLEALLSTFITLTVYFLLLSRRHLAWLIAAEATFVLGLLTKQSGVYILPLLLGVGVFRYRAARASRLARALPLIGFVAAAAFLAWYTSRDEYLRTVAWNYDHMVLGDKVNSAQRTPVIEALRRLVSRETWSIGFFTLFPVAGVLAIGEAVRTSIAVVRRRATDWEVIVTLWAVSSFAVLLFTPYLAIHYRLILFPPVAALAGAAVARLLRLGARRSWIRPAIALVVAAEIGLHLIWFAAAAQRRTYDMLTAERAIERAVGPREAVFAGMWAGPLVFGTRYRWYYIKAIFNQQREVIDSFGITHQLEMNRNEIAGKHLQSLYRDELRDRRRLLGFDLRERHVDLYALSAPLRTRPLRAKRDP
ncbi:Hypothetical protein A7982_04019 [Minicystis rosea]|nr:Hypothetical protein A7982_04019 [Minicystis rosea]